VSDPYVLPNGVLRNILGITDGHKLATFEASVTRMRMIALLREPIRGDFDLKHLSAVHRYLFADVYEWAGNPRTVDISKGPDRFAPHPHIASSFDQLVKPIVDERLCGAPTPTWAKDAALAFSELNAVHPFREGNGRTGRLWIRQLARENGIDLKFERVSALEMRGASILAFAGQYGQMESLFERIRAPYNSGKEHGIATITAPKATFDRTVPTSIERDQTNEPEMAGAPPTQLVYWTLKSGDVVYAFKSDQERHELFRDRGTEVAVKEQSADAVRAAVRVAREKWGTPLTFEGSAAFKERALGWAVAMGLDVTNAELRLRHSELAKIVPETNTGRELQERDLSKNRREIDLNL